MKNIIFRKRLLPLVLLFVMLANCTGCAVQWAKTPNEENTKRKECEKVSQVVGKETSEVTAEEAEVPDQIDRSLLGNWYMSNEEYDEMMSNSNVCVGAE